MFEMEREEKQEVEQAKKDAEMEIMAWREEQAVGMREYTKEKQRMEQKEDLLASKEFQEFKRERKQVTKEEELQQIKEQYQYDMEFSQFQADIAKMAVVDRHALVLESLEEIQDQRELRATEHLREKQLADQERAQEQRLEFHHQANQLSNEKEELLKNLQLLRQRKKLPVTSNRGLTTAGKKH